MATRYMVIRREPKRVTEFSERILTFVDTRKAGDRLIAERLAKEPDSKVTYRLEKTNR